MAIVKTDTSNYLAIADAIRAKGVEGSWKPSEMPNAIAEIAVGGEGNATYIPDIYNTGVTYQLYTKSSNTGEAYAGKQWKYTLLNTTWKDTWEVSISLTWATNVSYGFLTVQVGYWDEDTSTLYSIYSSGTKDSSLKVVGASINPSLIPEEGKDKPIVMVINHRGAANDILTLTFSGQYEGEVGYDLVAIESATYSPTQTAVTLVNDNFKYMTQYCQLIIDDTTIEGIEGGKF